MAESLKHARVAFTGKLASMTRAAAHQKVREAEGEPVPGVSRRTSMLVIGMEGWPLLPDGKPSSKLRRAEDLQKRGHPIRILSEALFLELMGQRERQLDLRKTYPLEQVCRLLELEPEAIRRWEQLSLVRSEEGLYDFQDIVSLRKLAELIKSGVRPGTIAKSLEGLAIVLPGTDRPLAQLKIVVENSKTLLADFGDCRLHPSGQLFFNFDARAKPEAPIVPLGAADPVDALTPEEWFERGQTLEEEERHLEAEEAYRKAILLAPHFPEAYFNLGNVVGELGRLEAAEELYRMAASQNPSMAIAWYNLADVQERQGRISEAVSSLKAALKASPQYADAEFNLALCLEKSGREAEAGAHWTAYLKLDPHSPWAQAARQHLSGRET
jgi:tetratricopeptide (TPR) repeat protein